MGKDRTSMDASLFWWWYDDKVTIGSTVKRGKKYHIPALLKNESDYNKHTKQLEELEAKKSWKIEKKKPKELPIGIESFSADYFERYDKWETFSKNAFQAFVEMTQPTWAAEERCAVVELVAAILSSYVMNQILDEESEIEVDPIDKADLRALYVTISNVENGMLGVRRLVDSMIVSTAVDKKPFKLHAPTIIQTKAEGKIIDEANLHLKHCDYNWPVPYRDTAVLLDARAFKNKDIEEFANLNPWCTCLLYGKKIKLSAGYQISLKGTAFSRLESTWNQQVIYELVKAYVAHVPLLFEDEQSLFPRAWVQAGNLIQRYIDARHKLNGAERFKKEGASFLSFSFYGLYAESMWHSRPRDAAV